MPSVDRQSVRDSVEQLRADFNSISAAGNIPNETKVLIRGHFTLIEIMLAVFLQKTTRKNSKNSGIPPSQSDEDNSSSNSSSSAEKPKSQNRVSANKSERETVQVSTVEFCSVCSENLSDQEPDDIERRTTIDIIYEKVTSHVDAEIKCCPACDTINKAPFPDNMPGPLQYGNGIKAYVINLIIVQMVALKRVQHMVNALIDQLISQATILKYVWSLHLALEQWENQSVDWIIQQSVIHTDETSLKVNKKKHWIHVYSSGYLTLKFLHPKRGKEAIEEINIIPRYGGTIIHDCWASYLSYDHLRHGLCGSHLLRELAFIIEANEYRWAANMKRLLKSTCRTVSKRKRKKLSDSEYRNLQKAYRNILTRGANEMPSIPNKPDNKRGKLAKSDAHNLLERLKDHETAVLLFAKVSEVAFTNNRAERDLRMSKVKQKVSGCFRTEKYAKAYCRISSYLKTMQAKGYNPLVAIEMALTGEIYHKVGE